MGLADMRMLAAGVMDRNMRARQLAEVGASELERYGGEGQRWAQQLRKSPQAALAMADSMGGFGAITQRLQYANAIGSGNAQEVFDTILTHEGASGGKAYMDSVSPGERRIVKGADGFSYYEDGSRVLPNVTQEKEGEAQIEAYGAEFDPESIDKRRREFKTQLEQYQDIGLIRRQVQSAPDTKLGAITLVNRLQQQIDPGAIVREADVSLITGGLRSGVEMTFDDLNRWVNEDAGANVVVPHLKRVIMDMMDDKEDEYAHKARQMFQWADNVGWNEKARKRGFEYEDSAREAIANSERRAAELGVQRSSYQQAIEIAQQVAPEKADDPSFILDLIELVDSGEIDVQGGIAPGAVSILQALEQPRGPQPVTLEQLHSITGMKGGM